MSSPAIVAASRVRRRLREDAGRHSAPALALVTVGTVVVTVLAVAFALGPVVALLATVGAGVAGVARARRRPALRLARDGDHLPELAEEAARALRVGRSPVEALVAAAASAPPGGALSRELASVVQAVARGVTVVDAVDEWVVESRVDGVAVVGAAFVLALDAGGDAARALDGAAETLRERIMLRREVAALSSQARASAVVLAVAPPAFALVAAAVDPVTATFLVRTPIGLACLGIGVALDVAGWHWMGAITRSVQ